MSSDRERPPDDELARRFLDNVADSVAMVADRKYQEAFWYLEFDPEHPWRSVEFREAVEVFRDNFGWLATDDFWRNSRLSSQQSESIVDFNARLMDFEDSSRAGFYEPPAIDDARWMEVCESAERLLSVLKAVPGVRVRNYWSDNLPP